MGTEASAEAEWAWELQVEIPEKRVNPAGVGTVIKARGIALTVRAVPAMSGSSSAISG